MSEKRLLVVSIVIFAIVAIMALCIVLSKGTIFGLRLVSLTDEVSAEESLNIALNIGKEYISAKGEEIKPEVTLDGLIVESGYELSSANEDVAKIVDNKVVGTGEGHTTITAKYEDVEVSKEIKVIVPLTKMTFTSTSSSIRVGKDLQMKLQMQPSNASVDTITYTSSDESIATVNQNGIVTGIAPGKVTITVHDSYTDTTKTVSLTIKK